MSHEKFPNLVRVVDYFVRYFTSRTAIRQTDVCLAEGKYLESVGGIYGSNEEKKLRKCSIKHWGIFAYLLNLEEFACVMIIAVEANLNLPLALVSQLLCCPKAVKKFPWACCIKSLHFKFIDDKVYVG